MSWVAAEYVLDVLAMKRYEDGADDDCNEMVGHGFFVLLTVFPVFLLFVLIH